MDRCNRASLIDRSWGNSNCGNMPGQESKQKTFVWSLGSATVWSPQLPLPLLFLSMLKENMNTAVLTSVPGNSSLFCGDLPCTWRCWSEVASFGNTFPVVIFFLHIPRLWFMYHCAFQASSYILMCLMPGKHFLCGIYLNNSLCFCI